MAFVEKNLNSKDQLLLAGELGRAAFHAGKPCSPAKDKDFKAFLLSCGDRRVGGAPVGEAPMLTLLDAWMTRWREEANQAAACVSAEGGSSPQALHVAVPGDSSAVAKSRR